MPGSVPPPRPDRPLRIGLTGGIGAGKSTVAALWRERGLRVIDLDAHSRAVLDVPGDGVEEAIVRFGEGVRNPAGTIDRAAMARIVFADAAARADLEQIVLSRVDRAVAEEEAEGVEERVARGSGAGRWGGSGLCIIKPGEQQAEQDLRF